MSAPTPSLLTLTDTQAIAHLVSDAAMVAGRPHGRYRTVCGCEVLAASLTTQESNTCPSCRKALQ